MHDVAEVTIMSFGVVLMLTGMWKIATPRAAFRTWRYALPIRAVREEHRQSDLRAVSGGFARVMVGIVVFAAAVMFV